MPRRATDPRRQYLKLRGGRWFINYPIPKDLRTAYTSAAGRPLDHLVRAVGTGDLAEAARRKHGLLQLIEAEFTIKRRELRGVVPSELLEALSFREDMEEAANAEHFHKASALESVLVERAEAIYDKGGQSPAALKRAREFVRIAKGERTILEEFEDWMGSSALPDRTRAKYRTAVEEFAEFLTGHPLVADMTREAAIRYADWLNREARSKRTSKLIPLAFNTKRDRVMALSAFWSQWLSPRGKSQEQRNPWSELHITEKPTPGAGIKWDSTENTGRPKRREGFDAAELVAIFEAPGPRVGGATKYSKRTLLEVFSLGMLLGCRPDEVCSLTLGHIRKLSGSAAGYSLTFTDTKTQDGDRRIPVVHPVAVSIIARRIGKRTDPAAQLFAEFRPKGGKGDNLAELPLRALGRHLKRAAGLTAEAVPYCTRHTFATTIGNLPEVKDHAIKRYIGHKPEGMTDAHYRGVPAEALLHVAQHVKYPREVEKAMRAALECSA